MSCTKQESEMARDLAMAELKRAVTIDQRWAARAADLLARGEDFTALDLDEFANEGSRTGGFHAFDRRK